MVRWFWELPSLRSLQREAIARRGRRQSRALGPKLPEHVHAGRTLELGLGRRDLAVELLGSKRVVPTVANRYGFDFRYPELPDALRDVLGRD